MTMTIRSLNGFIWIFLVVGGGVLVLGGVITDRDRFALASGFATVLSLITWLAL